MGMGMGKLKLPGLKEHWMMYAAIAGGVLLAYQLYSAGKTAGTSTPYVSPAQQVLQAQDATLLNQLAQPDYNPINYVVPPTPAPTSLMVLGVALAGAYMIYGGGKG